MSKPERARTDKDWIAWAKERHLDKRWPIVKVPLTWVFPGEPDIVVIDFLAKPPSVRREMSVPSHLLSPPEEAP